VRQNERIVNASNLSKTLSSLFIIAFKRACVHFSDGDNAQQFPALARVADGPISIAVRPVSLWIQVEISMSVILLTIDFCTASLGADNELQHVNFLAGD